MYLEIWEVTVIIYLGYIELSHVGTEFIEQQLGESSCLTLGVVCLYYVLTLTELPDCSSYTLFVAADRINFSP